MASITTAAFITAPSSPTISGYKVKIEVIQGASIPINRRMNSLHQVGTNQGHQARSQRRYDLNGSRRPQHGYSDFFHLHRRSTGLDFGGKRNPMARIRRFRQVVKGMDVVKKIQAAKVEGQVLKPAIKITKVKRKD